MQLSLLGNKRKVSWTSGSMLEVFGATGALSWSKKNPAKTKWKADNMVG